MKPTTSNVPRPQAFGYGCALNGDLFRLAVGQGRELTIEMAPLEPPRVNTSSNPEESTEEFGLTFARSQFDGGEGQFRAHLEGAAANRFWDSRGVSIRPADPGEFPEIRLLKDTELTQASAVEELRSTRLDDVVYVAAATEVLRGADLTGTPTWTAEDPGSTTVFDVTVLGDIVYAACGADGIRRRVSGAWEAWSNVEATRVWGLKGRIVASNGPSLFEVTGSGASFTNLRTLSAGEVWTDAADGGAAILACATDGYVYAYSEQEGVLVLIGQSVFEGERPSALGAAQGVVAIGTGQPVDNGVIGRMWVGTLTESGIIADLQLVREWGGRDTTLDQAPKSIIARRDALWTGVPDEAGDTALWRYELLTAGIARSFTFDAPGAVYGIEVVGGRAIATVANAGIFREADTFVEEGYLIGPLGDFFSASPKSWVGARVEAGEIDGGVVELSYTVDPAALADDRSPLWTLAASRTIPFDDEVVLAGVSSRQLAGMVRLRANADRDKTPTVRSFGFRAYPGGGGETDVIVTLPVNVSDQIERPGRHRIRVPGRGHRSWSTLKELEGRPVLLELYRPQEKVRGLVEQVAAPVQVQARRGSSTMYAQVRVRGRRTTGDAGAGVGTFGSARFGLIGFGGIRYPGE